MSTSSKLCDQVSVHQVTKDRGNGQLGVVRTASSSPALASARRHNELY
jgi:hypothetical protein